MNASRITSYLTKFVYIYIYNTSDIDIYHADLGGRAVWGYNALDASIDKYESADDTFVAGLLGGKRVSYAKKKTLDLQLSRRVIIVVVFCLNNCDY